MGKAVAMFWGVLNREVVEKMTQWLSFQTFAAHDRPRIKTSDQWPGSERRRITIGIFDEPTAVVFRLAFVEHMQENECVSMTTPQFAYRAGQTVPIYSSVCAPGWWDTRSFTGASMGIGLQRLDPKSFGSPDLSLLTQTGV